MNIGRFQPQMTQMNADIFLKSIICTNLRLTNILEKIRV